MGNTLYTAKEAAEYLRVSVQTLKIWRRKGKIQAYNPGGNKLLFSQEQLDAVLSKPKRKFKLFGK
jgi:excisionase family DNA binding protein